jgi:hypothetical protein
MRQDEYREGRYDTTWLDRLMAARRGASFNELDEADAKLVTIAAAVEACLRARASATEVGQGAGPSGSVWQRTARVEALRV